MSKRQRFVSAGCAMLLVACGARQSTPTIPSNQVVEMDGLRIVARPDAQGGFSFDSYDAEDLFRRANGELDAGRCPEAVLLYDRLVAEFAGSRYASAALYNAGLCLAQTGEREAALARFERLLGELPSSPDVKHASFQAGHLLVELERWEHAIARADALLLRTDLDSPERMEAMAMRAQALLGQQNLAQAEKQAQQSLTYYRTRGSELAADPYYAAAANYVVAECIRLRAEALAFPDTNQEEQKAILVKRAQLLLDAMREYANTITHTSGIITTNPKWAAASGYRIGAMYDKLWHDLMGAPVPATLSPGAKELYPQELAKLIKPLLRHAIRYWELTLLMAERTGGRGEWVEKTRSDLERTRGLLLEQPPGPGGLPPPKPSPAPSGH
jgi:outer membrane protein assembly factor BamD (BamD/ComL family)